MSYEASLRLHVPSLRAYFHTVSADVQFNQFLFGANSLAFGNPWLLRFWCPVLTHSHTLLSLTGVRNGETRSNNGKRVLSYALHTLFLPLIH
jgi:hypothetical protein